jgi:hypothetical protein
LNLKEFENSEISGCYTFDNMRKFKMKLNPKKCIFGVPSGKLLGYIVSSRGIDPNPEKVSAITKMKPPESLHDV